MKIFISYAKKDRTLIQEIYSFLQENGCDPWLDSEMLIPGQDWKKAIREAQKTSGKCLICISKNYLDVKKGFRWDELREALELSRQIPENGIYLDNGPQKLDRGLRWKTEEPKVGREVFRDEKDAQKV